MARPLLDPRAMFRRVLVLLAFVSLVACGGGGDDGPDTTDRADAGATGELPFMSMCETDEQCETGLCYPFNAHGPHCTHTCETDLDCEEPSPGCNGMGVCKRPH